MIEGVYGSCENSNGLVCNGFVQERILLCRIPGHIDKTPNDVVGEGQNGVRDPTLFNVVGFEPLDEISRVGEA